MQEESLTQAESLSSEYLSKKLLANLQNRFQLTQFRPGQLQAMLSLLQKKRLLCIQPTGHGKSLLYQLPSILLPGITIVISPLLALMRDQISHLIERFNISAASINTDQTDDENAQAQLDSIKGKIKILFIAPEKLDHLNYFQFLTQLPISLIVIDEAHCISTWGHDFRPSYRQIMPFINTIERKNTDIHVLAITATANPKTEEDIRQHLTTTYHNVIVQRQSMKRDNIQLSVLLVSNLIEKLSTLKQLVNQLTGNGIIYCSTRDKTELVADYLQHNHFNVIAYHAGYAFNKKQQLQQQFIHNHYKAIAATNALGMGIDKQDVRFIIHFDIPGSITAYYQEVGRCGRDGKSAYGILLFNESDIKVQQYFIDSAQPRANDFQLILNTIKNSDIPLNLIAIKQNTGLHPTQVNVIIAELIEQEFIVKQLIDGKQCYKVTEKQGNPDLSRYQMQLTLRTNELNGIIQYTKEKQLCLMMLLSQTLGDTVQYRCGHCDNCHASPFIIKQEITQETKAWLLSRSVSIHLGRLAGVEEGVSIFDGQMRSHLFIEFMKTRLAADAIMNPDLLNLIQKSLQRLQNQYNFNVILTLPSNTWMARHQISEFIAEILQVPVWLDALTWKQNPENRQGELLNNDQRRTNVDRKMQFKPQSFLSNGTILLVDDYTGSGATLKEAVRAMKPLLKVSIKVVPFTIASVRWRLGKRGMI